MKISNQTKNMRQRFFRSARRRLSGVFGSNGDSVQPLTNRPGEPLQARGVSEVLGRKPLCPGASQIYTAPAKQKQGEKGKK